MDYQTVDHPTVGRRASGYNSRNIDSYDSWTVASDQFAKSTQFLFGTLLGPNFPGFRGVAREILRQFYVMG